MLFMHPNRYVSILTLCTFLGAFMSSQARAQAVVTVPAGTVITCAFDNPVSPTAVSVGQMITLKVVDAVVVEGATVVQAGASVRAEVTAAETRGSVGKPAKIQVSLRTVTAVDGTNIPVTATKSVEGENKQTSSLVITILCCVLGLLQKGGDAEIPAGATVTATTLSAAQVNVSK